MTRPLDGYLQTADALSRLQDHAARLVRLQSVLDELIPPPLGEACRVANLRQDELIIHVSHGAAAARLKQMLPTLQEGYTRRGHAIASIKVRVHLEAPRPGPPPPRVRQVSPVMRDELARLAEHLPKESPLAAALARFIRRSG